MRVSFWSLGLITLVLLFSACAPPPELRDFKFLRDDSLVTSNEECAPPCWRDITPGETTWADAFVIVQDDPDFAELETQEDEASGAIGAQWKAKDGESCCQMIAEDGEIVNLLFIRLAPNNLVGDLLEERGEPEYAIGASISEDQAIVHLIYPEMGMIVYGFVAGTEASLTEDSEIIAVLYTTTDAMDLLMQTSNLHEWEGLSSYATYDGAEGADFEITPSITLTPSE